MQMKSGHCLLLGLMVLFTSGKAEELKITEAFATDGSETRYALIDVDDPELKARLIAAANREFGGQVFIQNANKGAEKGPMVIAENRRGSMRREKAGRDFLIGSGLCLGACLFVQVAGTDMDKTQPAEGLFVQAGNKVVTGGAAVLPCILGTTGLVFLGRSVIEVFLPSAGSYESSQVQTTGELMAGGKLKAGQTLKLDTKNYSVEDLEREVLMFCVSII